MRRRLKRALGVVCLCAAVALPADAQFGYHFGRNKVQYENFDWNVLQTEHFDVYYYDGMQELAEHGWYFVEEIYHELENKFNFSFRRRVPIIFYSSNLHFKQTNVIPSFIPDNVGGFFEFLKGRVVVPSNGDVHHFRRVIRHEIVHVFTFYKLFQTITDHRQPLDRIAPLWFTEGLAEYWSGEPDDQHEMVIRDAIASNYLVPLDNMYRISGSYLMYKQGEAICRFIAEEYGEDKLLLLIDNAWKSRSFSKIMEITLRERIKDISIKWDTWLKEQYYPLFQDTDLPTLLTDAISVEGFNSKPAVYINSEGQRLVYYVGNHSGYTNLYAVAVDDNYRPVAKPKAVIRGERNDTFESFHVFDSKIDISESGLLTFVTKSGSQDVIHVYDIENKELMTTLRFDDLVAVSSPSWNPGGNALVFSSIGKNGFRDLYIYDLGQGELRKLTDDTYDDVDPAWSPDGNRIAFSSDRTNHGALGAYNIFSFDLADSQIRYVTFGTSKDSSPSWSPDGDVVVYTSSRRDSTGKFSGRDIWAIDATAAEVPANPIAASSLTGLPVTPIRRQSTARQLTRLTSAVQDPVWTDDGNLIVSAFEHFRFMIRKISDADSLLANPRSEETVTFGSSGETWTFPKVSALSSVRKSPYKKKYNLDIAQSQVNQNAVWGTTGGAFVAISDLLGDDYWYFTVYNSAQAQSDFLKSFSVAVSRTQLHRRANTSYGVYRLAGYRYDLTDPDAASAYPLFWETVAGGFASVSYPISQFRRLEVGTSFNWSDKEVFFRDIERKALLLSNSVSLVHDNALYGYNGPIDGWRANVTAAYTTDVLYSNVNYLTLGGDVRNYWRPTRDLTFASRFFGRINTGKEARLNVMGGSWDLRGYPLFGVRGRKVWFTSQELRFPIVKNPGVIVPFLGAIGIVGLRGAAYFDAAHAWNFAYNEPNGQLLTGETLGSAGVGLRLNLFYGLVLRYDVGFRHRDNFQNWEKRPYRQFFFGWDF